MERRENETELNLKELEDEEDLRRFLRGGLEAK